MATIEQNCERCSQQSIASVSQRAGYDGAFWSMSFSCPTCKNTFAAECGYDTPDYVRNAILATEGLWQLRVEPRDSERVKAITTLRAALHLSLAEAARIKKAIPGVVQQGTRAEMEYVRHRLWEQGITSVVEQVE